MNVSLAQTESCQARNQARLGAQAGGDRPWGLKVAGSDRGFFEEGRVAASSAPIAFVQNSLLISERISDNFLQSKFAVCMRPVDEVQLWAM